MRLSERRHRFNIRELCQVVSKALNRNVDDITTSDKIAEGGSYRVFEVTFHDETKVIVRLPYRSTIPRNYGIASEVATMEFLRLHGVPIPKVFDWSSSTSNEVGSEYIIMEKAKGVSLNTVWPRTNIADRWAILRTLVEPQNTWASTLFPAYGSLYYSSDLSPGTHSVPCEVQASSSGEAFVIGPTEGRDWSNDGRTMIDFDRGPCE